MQQRLRRARARRPEGVAQAPGACGDVPLLFDLFCECLTCGPGPGGGDEDRGLGEGEGPPGQGGRALDQPECGGREPCGLG